VQIIVPQALDRNVELTAMLLVDGLHPESGDRPLPPDPEDVAMQRHIARFALEHEKSEPVFGHDAQTRISRYSITLRPPM
jgi:hypothetical protein